MIIRVNNDVILGLTTGHWSRQAWPQCDIIIDSTYHRFPYFRTGQIHNNREKVPTFVYIIVNIPAPRPLNNNACGLERQTRCDIIKHDMIVEQLQNLE